MCLRADWLPALSYQRSPLTDCSLIRLSLIFFFPRRSLFSTPIRLNNFRRRGGQAPAGLPLGPAPRTPAAAGGAEGQRPSHPRPGIWERTRGTVWSCESPPGGARGRCVRCWGGGVRAPTERGRRGVPELGVGRPAGGLTAYLQADLPGASVRHAAPRVVGCKRGQRHCLAWRDLGGTAAVPFPISFFPRPAVSAGSWDSSSPRRQRREERERHLGPEHPIMYWRGSREVAA